MKKLLFLLLMMNTAVVSLSAQKYFTRTGDVSFTSTAPLETIEAVNKSAVSVIDLETGQLEFAVLIKAFQFEKALMQEHFNENYMESSTFPKGIFKGKIENYTPIKLSQDAEYPVTVSGQMTIHGVTKDIKAQGILMVKDGHLSAGSGFELTIADFDITIPKIVRDKIAKTVKVLVEMKYERFSG